MTQWWLDSGISAVRVLSAVFGADTDYAMLVKLTVLKQKVRTIHPAEFIAARERDY
jgi:hypothetical protein